MNALCELLEQHERAVAGDLWELYGIDVYDVFRGSRTVTARRAVDLAERATHDPRSHLRAELMGSPDFIGWGPTQDAIAETADSTTALVVLVHRALAKGSTLSAVPFPRPGRSAAGGEDRPPQPATLADVAGYLTAS